MKETESNTKQSRLAQCSYLSSWSRPVSLKEKFLKKFILLTPTTLIKILFTVTVFNR